jgi:hypothetical protein
MTVSCAAKRDELPPFGIGTWRTRPDCWDMPTLEECQRLADECRRNAKEAEDADERHTLLRIAALWDELAERKTRKGSENQ